MILTVGIFLLFASVPAVADQVEDEAAIRELQKQVYIAASSHDAKAWLAAATEDAETWGETRGSEVQILSPRPLESIV
jgi:hypothetical protein